MDDKERRPDNSIPESETVGSEQTEPLQVPVPREPVPQGPVAQEDVSPETAAQEPAGKGDMSPETAAQEPAGKGDVSPETAAQESVSKEEESSEVAPQESASQEEVPLFRLREWREQRRAGKPPLTEQKESPLTAPKNVLRQGMEKSGCLGMVSYCLLLIGISVLLASGILLAANDIFALVKGDQAVTLTVPEGAGIKEVAALLEDNGVIQFPTLFRLYAGLTDMDTQIRPGEYGVNVGMDYRTLLGKVRYKASTRAVVTVTVPEGLTQEEIFALLEENGVCAASLLRAYAKYYDFGYSFLEGLDYTDNRLEGYLFPDTYDFYVDSTPQQTLRKFLANFSRKWDVDLKARAANINLSIREVVIIASMIEREARYDDERPVIASVIHNRLGNAAYPNLQIDATVHYAISDWSRPLTKADLETNSPYNTYVVSGLPVGPISNPGLAAIRAVLYPEETEYYYYVARKNGWHYFAKTSSEHEANIDKASREDGTETVVDSSGADILS